jgi:hypothetical protein
MAFRVGWMVLTKGTPILDAIVEADGVSRIKSAKSV